MKLNQAAAIIAISALALTACSGGDDDNEKAASKSASGSDAGIISPADLPTIPVLKKERGIVADTAITNTGSTVLNDVAVDDPMLAGAGVDVSCPRETLRPGQSVVCESEPYTITAADVDAGGVHNVATATATPPGGGDLESDESSASITTEGDSGFLPNTGAGFTWWMPLAGLALLAGGFWMIVSRPGSGRRRKV